MQLWNETNPEYKKSIPYRFAYLFCLLILFYLGYKWQSNLSSVMDILAADEAEYLRNGISLFDKLYKDWGPSYNIWYKFLSLFAHTKVELYYLNYSVTAIVSTLLLFIVLEKYEIQITVALFISGLFLLSEINIQTWPRVSHFVFILLLCGLFIAKHLRYHTQKLFLFSAIAVIAAYARPEIRPFAFLLFAISCLYWFKEKAPLKPVLFFVAIAVFAFIAFQLIYGSPASFYRGNVDRMYIAFCQHVAINQMVHFHDKSVDAMAGWRIYADRVFPQCDTFMCILKTYPGAVFQNIYLNISNYLITIISTLGSFLFPVILIPKQKVFIAVCSIMILLMLVFLFYKPFRIQLVDALKKHRWQFLAVFIIGLPSMITSILIFPRMHYILCHIFLFIFVLAFIFSVLYKTLRLPSYTILLVIAFFIIISPTAKNYNFFRSNKDLANLCCQKYITYFNKDDKAKHVIFSDILNFSYMLPDNYSDFSVEYNFKKGMQFDSVRLKDNIDIILVNENILKNPYLLKDSTWNIFLQHYDEFGFEKKAIYNECNIYLLQKKQ